MFNARIQYEKEAARIHQETEAMAHQLALEQEELDPPFLNTLFQFGGIKIGINKSNFFCYSQQRSNGVRKIDSTAFNNTDLR